MEFQTPVSAPKPDLPDGYLSVVYDEKRTPKTEYPFQLAAYLTKRFSLPAGGTLIELGAGRGDFLAGFQALGFKTMAVDREISPSVARMGIPALRCDLAKEKLSLPDASVDVVFHKSVLEHLHDPYGLMDESLRILRPGGKLIVMTPDWVSGIRVFFEDFSHVHPYTYEAVRDLLQVYGLQRITAERFRQLPAAWNSRGARVLSVCVGACLSTPFARKLTQWTKWKIFRWSTELMVLAVGEKPSAPSPSGGSSHV